MFSARRIAVAILFSTCLSFQTNLNAKTALPRQRRVDQASSISKVAHQWAREWDAKHLEALIDLYADDAVFMTATGTRATGQQAIRELFKQALTGSGSQLKIFSRETEAAGNLAYDSGEYNETSIANGVTKSGKGNYLIVLRRERNDWRIVQHMWTDASRKQ